MKRKLSKEEINIFDQRIQIERIADIEELFEELLQKDKEALDVKDERIPYWCEVWASAIGLSRFIVENKNLFANKSVIEIGAGLGLPSIVASNYTNDICITDYIQEAVDFAKRNWHLNHQGDFASFELLDWRNISAEHKKFDIILASDVAYERAGFESLFDALKNLIKPGGIILLSEPNRYLGKIFIDKMISEKIIVQTCNYEVDLYQKMNNISVYQLQPLL